MSPITHFLGSWLCAAYTTDNPRDRRLVTLAGILPDADGLGLVVDLSNLFLGRPETYYYAEQHHFLLHGAFGGVMLSGLAALMARRRWRVALVVLAVFHLHMLCDFLGSRGPSPTDLWPIYYLAPFSRSPMWAWEGQWRLDSWPNGLISVGCLVWALGLALRRGESFVGVLSPRADAVFVGVLRKWRNALWKAPPRPPPATS